MKSFGMGQKTDGAVLGVVGGSSANLRERRGSAMTKEQAGRKLKALKALAERGVGGEKETAQRLYEELKRKYGAEEETEREATGSDSAISMFYMGMMDFTLYQELENCNECPYQNGQEICEQCGTYANIKEICRRIEEAKRESGQDGNAL